MWVTKLMISQVKKRTFCPKTTKFGPKLAFLVNLGQAMQAYSVPCWWVGWWLWRAGCISQDTYLLYTYSISELFWVTQDPQFSMARFLTLVFLCAQLFSHSESMSSAPLLENLAINTSTMPRQVKNRAINTCGDCATLSSK